MATNNVRRRQRLRANGTLRTHSRMLPSRLGKKHESTAKRRLGIVIGGFLGVIFLIVSLFGAGLAVTYSGIAANLKPRLAQINEYKPFQASRIYDRNGTLLYEFVGTGRRTPIKISDVSPDIIKATIAIEDASFYENSGVSYVSIIRAGLAQVFRQNQNVGVGGASTITQQVVRIIILTKQEREEENVYSRKLKEIILARELTDKYTKDEILELYLNEIPYGNLSYGIQAASRSYFNVDAKDVSLAQASLLAGLPQLPTLYNPIQYLNENNVLPGVRLPRDIWLDPTFDYRGVENIKQISPTKFRQIDVLRQMVKVGNISESKARKVAAEDLTFQQPKVSLLAPHFVFFVREYLEKTYGSEVVGNGGLTITTTLDLNLQAIAQTQAYSRIMELKADERNINNAAVVIMQPNTGQILSMVGSIGYDLSETTTTPGEEGNVLDGKVNVTTALRQPGSALKPITYLTGFEQYLKTEGASGFTPASVIWDVPTIFNPRGVKYEPENFDKKAHGPLRPRTAVSNSLNIPAVKALKAAGIPATLDVLHRLGIAPTSLANDPGYYGLALTLGGGEVTPLDLATAYNTLASGGRYFAPTPILKITDSEGKVLEEFKPTPLADLSGEVDVSDVSKCVVPTIEEYQLGKRVPNGTQCVDGRLVYIITNMISDNEARRPIFGSNSVLKLSQPAAVKTGTTNDFRDAWASGFTPFMTVTVWTGNNNNEKTANVESTQGGGVIWNRVMESVFKRPDLMQKLAEPYGSLEAMPQAFPKSYPGVFRDDICEIPGPFGGRTDELFVKGLYSAGKCDLYTKVEVIRLSVKQGDNPDAPSTTTYCKPVAGGSYPPDSRITIYVWNLPKGDLDEKIDLTKWKGFTGDESLGAEVTAQIDPEQLPLCDKVIAAATPTPAATATPDPNVLPTQPPVQPGQIIMPSLRGLGENQARQALYALGVRPDQIIVDYQGRDRIGGDFDLFPAYTVLSSQPAPGSVISANTTIVLGVRAPDAAPPPPTDVPPPPPTDVPPPPPEQPTEIPIPPIIPTP